MNVVDGVLLKSKLFAAPLPGGVGRHASESPMKTKQLRIVTSALLITIGSAWIGASDRPSKALPIYSRRFGVSCDTCHTVAPALNKFGLAFQANHFNWTAGKPPHNRLGLDALPISVLDTYDSVRNNTFNFTTDEFSSFELFASNGFVTNHGATGGYFVDYYTGRGNFVWGQLGNAFVSLPVAGRRGEAAITFGQFSPMMYQYDGLNSLLHAQPAALSTGADAFSLTAPIPGVRAEYFNGRGRGTANGLYVNAGIPFTGTLTFNNHSQVDGPRGFYVDAFERRDTYSYGLYSYRHDSNHTESLVGTYTPCPWANVTAAASEGRDVNGSGHQYSVQADLTPREDIGATVRLENTESPFEASTTFPVLGLTYYPGRQHVIRVLGQTIQNPHNRSSAIFLYGQF